MGNKIVETLAALTTSSQEVIPDILVMNFRVVTACLVGKAGAKTGEWVLVDTGLENSADYILECAENRFGKDSRPQAIILTHGHFDHVGSVLKLSEFWDVPVYIHERELPYVTGQKDYPLADPEVDEGLVAKLSPTFPHHCIDLGFRAVALPSDGTVPGMPGWRWIPAPGHTEGQITLFRNKDRVLLAADAFCTLKQESLISILTQHEQISGPPKYLTEDWKAAEESIKRLKDLNPSLAIPSHGQPMKGEELRQHLDLLLNDFQEIAVPEHGKPSHTN